MTQQNISKDNLILKEDYSFYTMKRHLDVKYQSLQLLGFLSFWWYDPLLLSQQWPIYSDRDS